MDLLQRVEGNTLVLKVFVRQLNAASASVLRRRIAKLAGSGSRRLVLDISEVETIDSNGLSALVFALKRLQFHNLRNFAISGPRESVMSMLKLTRLYRVFDIFPNCEQAIAALGS
ncbi:MAG TPA: STAS domain-containing protein [Candidatus Binataceae bacterium]|nr:STAS domain-containing protein [Candidatus Binataceae bacterium]